MRLSPEQIEIRLKRLREVNEIGRIIRENDVRTPGQLFIQLRRWQDQVSRGIIEARKDPLTAIDYKMQDLLAERVKKAFEVCEEQFPQGSFDK